MGRDAIVHKRELQWTHKESTSPCLYGFEAQVLHKSYASCEERGREGERERGREGEREREREGQIEREREDIERERADGERERETNEREREIYIYKYRERGRKEREREGEKRERERDRARQRVTKHGSYEHRDIWHQAGFAVPLLNKVEFATAEAKPTACSKNQSRCLSFFWKILSSVWGDAQSIQHVF